MMARAKRPQSPNPLSDGSFSKPSGMGLEVTGLSLVALNGLITYVCLQNPAYFEAGLLRTAELRRGQWYRLLTAGFLHVDYNHLFLNLFSLFIFAGSVESFVGPRSFLLIYFSALLGGNILAYAFHRHHPQYSAVGASGAVSGVIFAAIALFPDMQLAFIFLPIYFPAWIFGLGYIIYSLYGMGRQHDNVGHEAHLGGALSGLLTAVALEPWVMDSNGLTIVYLAVPAVVLLIVLFVRPRLLQKGWGGAEQAHDIDDRYRAERLAREQERNRILEKISRQGESALSAEERRFLENETKR